jgi:hypothetical protein
MFNFIIFVSEEIWLDTQRSPKERLPMSNDEVFAELISQRLAQGFQLILAQDGKEPFAKANTLLPR